MPIKKQPSGPTISHLPIVPVKTIGDVVDCLNEDGFLIREECGYDIMDKVANKIMKELGQKFGVKEVDRRESGDRDGGMYVEFSPLITEAQWEDYQIFLTGRKF